MRAATVTEDAMRSHAHDPLSIRRRLERGPRTSYLRDFVYGGIDGAVTTFALVTGVVGAELSTRTLLILGSANLLADGFSMAASNYLGTRAEHEEYARAEAFERAQIRKNPDGERQEVRQILARKGFTGEALEQAVSTYTEDESRWITFMVQEEYGLSPHLRRASSAGLATFAAFFVCGAAALIPYALGLARPFVPATVATAAVFFGIGSLKSRWTSRPWWQQGLETLAVGGAAAVLAYGVGVLLR